MFVIDDKLKDSISWLASKFFTHGMSVSDKQEKAKMWREEDFF